MNIKIIKALSRHGYIHSKTNLFPDYIVESSTEHPGIKQMLDHLNIDWIESGTIMEKEDKKEIGDITYKYANLVANFNHELRDAVANSIETDSDFPLTIGGDHSSSIGSIAGILQKRPNLGVLWIDAHSDIHTPETTETGWIYGMPAAIIQGKGNQILTAVMKNNYVQPENLCLFGVRYVEKGEMENIQKWGIKVITMDDIDEQGIAFCYNEAIKHITKNTNSLHVSLDIDVVDKMFAPGATEPTEGGLTFREINYITRKLGQSNLVQSMDLVEGEPDKDINYQTGRLCLQMIANILGKRYSEYDLYLENNKI